MKIYTKKGDKGYTGLFGGNRVLKSHPRVQAYGAVDSASSFLGFVLSSSLLPAELKEPLQRILKNLFCLGAELAVNYEEKDSLKSLPAIEKILMKEDEVLLLEKQIDTAEAKLEPLKNFILPTGNDAACRLHMGRTQVRLAEQNVVALVESGLEVRSEILEYLNRLSDLLFVWARLCNKSAGIKETICRAS